MISVRPQGQGNNKKQFQCHQRKGLSKGTDMLTMKAVHSIYQTLKGYWQVKSWGGGKQTDKIQWYIPNHQIQGKDATKKYCKG